VTKTDRSLRGTLPLQTQNQIARFLGISIQRLKQLIAEGRKNPAHGVNLTPDLLPMNEKGTLYLPVSRERANFIKSSIIALKGSVDPRRATTGRFTRK
jgi:hypothetical protein